MTIWTTSTVTVTTNPVRAAIAPTIADRTVVAVEGEYCHWAGRCALRSICVTTTAPTRPRSAPSSGRVQMLSTRYWRTRKPVAQVTCSPAPRLGIPDRCLRHDARFHLLGLKPLRQGDALDLTASGRR